MHVDDSPIPNSAFTFLHFQTNTNPQTQLQQIHQLSQANHLQTQSEPKIYWRPYLLISSQESQIAQQISQAKTKVETGELEFPVRRCKDLDNDSLGIRGKDLEDSPLRTRNDLEDEKVEEGMLDEVHGGKKQGIGKTEGIEGNDVDGRGDVTPQDEGPVIEE